MTEVKDKARRNPAEDEPIHLSSQGYIVVKVPRGYLGAYPDGRILEHRLIAKQKLGRALMPDEVCHHVNGIKVDNQPENIVVISRRNHPSEHGHPQALRELSKTHCPHGHPYDEVNTRLYQGRRFCRTCMRIQNQQRRDRK